MLYGGILSGLSSKPNVSTVFAISQMLGQISLGIVMPLSG